MMRIIVESPCHRTVFFSKKIILIKWKCLFTGEAMISKQTTIILLFAAIVSIMIGLRLGPIPQPQAYHNFADQRTVLNIVNGWNVLSNIPFALAGMWGLYLLSFPAKIHFIDDREKWPWIGVSIGLILTAIGSSYYHLMPDNSRLVWDRLPMTITFMSYVAALLCERISIRLGLWLWPFLLIIGFISVFLWQASEWRGASDLRFYIGLQVFTILITLIMLLAPSPYTRTWNLAIVALCYGLAIIFEAMDHQIHALSGSIISGHTLKHLAAALAGAWLIQMIWKRKIIKHEKHGQ